MGICINTHPIPVASRKKVTQKVPEIGVGRDLFRSQGETYGCFPKIGVPGYPKMNGENKGKAYSNGMIWGYHYFLETPTYLVNDEFYLERDLFETEILY